MQESLWADLPDEKRRSALKLLLLIMKYVRAFCSKVDNVQVL